jgi:hypothetical protein
MSIAVPQVANGSRTALEAGHARDQGWQGQGMGASGAPRHESIGSPNRAESLADLDLSTRRRRTMALQRTTLGQRAVSYRDLVRTLVVVAAVIVLMLLLTAIFGVQQGGPSYEIVPDPASDLGLPF